MGRIFLVFFKNVFKNNQKFKEISELANYRLFGDVVVFWFQNTANSKFDFFQNAISKKPTRPKRFGLSRSPGSSFPATTRRTMNFPQVVVHNVHFKMFQTSCLYSLFGFCLNYSLKVLIFHQRDVKKRYHVRQIIPSKKHDSWQSEPPPPLHTYCWSALWFWG